jgi:hypothetical protein
MDSHSNWKKGQVLIQNNLARESKEKNLDSNDMSTQTSTVDLTV